MSSREHFLSRCCPGFGAPRLESRGNIEAVDMRICAYETKCMSLQHALLVSLAEREASGYDLTRRFDRSLGFFWSCLLYTSDAADE